MAPRTNLECPHKGPSVETQTDRVLGWQPTGPNPLNHRDDFSRLALRHGSVNPNPPLYSKPQGVGLTTQHLQNRRPSSLNPLEVVNPKPTLYSEPEILSTLNSQA